jgi:hypothetical protein
MGESWEIAELQNFRIAGFHHRPECVAAVSEALQFCNSEILQF